MYVYVYIYKEVRNSRVMKSSYETELRKMTKWRHTSSY